MAAIKNSSVVLPIEYGREIIRGVLGRSKVLELGRRIPNMRGETYKLNVLSQLPVAGWVKNSATPAGESKEIKNKPLSVLAFEGVNLEAEEIAVIIPIAINTLEDVENFGIELSTEISEQVVGAFQEVIDSAVLFGKDTPWTSATNLDAGLVAAAADAGAVVVWNGQGGTSFYDAISDAMSYVEKSGYQPTAILGGPALEGYFRKTITTLGVVAGDQGQVGALPRHIDLTGGFDEATADAIVGDFRYLVYSFREEMRMRLLEEATLVDPATGNTLYNLAQQDMVALRFTMRFAAALPNPVNRVGSKLPEGSKAYPFAVIAQSAIGSN